MLPSGGLRPPLAGSGRSNAGQEVAELSFEDLWRRLDGTCRQVEPLACPVADGGQANPMQDAMLVRAQIEDGCRRRAVEEVDAPLAPGPLQEKPPDAGAGQLG